MVFGLKSGVPVPTSGSAFDDYAPALSITSREDMCEKGGITAIFVILFVVVYVGMKYWLSITENNHAHNLFNRNGRDSKPFFARLEEVFVTPFVPSSIDSFVMWIFMSWFIITIPMAFTRHYEKRWAHDTITLHGPWNSISWLIGCKSIPLEAIPYTEHLGESIPPSFPAPPPSEKGNRIDYYLTYHLAFGILWLFLGFVQIFRAKLGDWSSDHAKHYRFHKLFGRFAMCFLGLHILMMIFMTVENPVNQSYLIRFGYCSMIFDSCNYAIKGINFAKAGNIENHKLYMFYTYVRSTMGSGSIRFSAWALWLIGKFLPPHIRVRLDRGDCQTYAQQGIGDASDCWEPVFINLLFTDFIVLWLEVLFLKMMIKTTPGNALNQECNIKVHKIQMAVKTIVPTLFFVLTDHVYDTPLAEVFTVVWFVIMRLENHIWKSRTYGEENDHPHAE